MFFIIILYTVYMFMLHFIQFQKRRNKKEEDYEIKEPVKSMCPHWIMRILFLYRTASGFRELYRHPGSHRMTGL